MINFVCASYIIMWATSRAFEVAMIYRILAIIAAAVWCFTIKQINPDTFEDAKSVISVGVFYCLITFAGTYLLFGTLDKAVSDTINPVVILIFFLFYYGYRGTKYFKWLVVFAVLCYLFVGISTLYQLYLDPRAVRDAYIAWTDGDASRITSIGTYGFIVSSAQLAPVLIMGFMAKAQDGKLKLLFIITAICLALTVIFAGYTIPSIAMLVMMMVFLMMNNQSPVKIMLILMVGIALIFTWKDVLGGILQFAMNLSENNPTYKVRFEELYNSIFMGTEMSGDLLSRYDAYKRTLTYIVDNPMLGAAFWGNQYFGAGHSEYLDALGKFGVLYLIWHVWITLVKPSQVIRSPKTLGIQVSFIVSVIILCVFDTYNYMQTIVAIIILPYVAEVFAGDEKNGYEFIPRIRRVGYFEKNSVDG